jgi:hypothetical protein
MAASDIAKPLLKGGISYAFEIARCLLLGIALSVCSFFVVLYFTKSEGNSGAPTIAALFALLFPFLYGLAGHQRGLGRVLASLTKAHGGLLFEQTIGRFIDAAEARKPGSVAGLLAAPAKFANAVEDFLNDSARLPRWLKRVALNYTDKLMVRIDESGALPVTVIDNGQLHRAQFQQWAVDHMSDQFSPSWRLFGLVFLLHALVTAGLAWMGH